MPTYYPGYDPNYYKGYKPNYYQGYKPNYYQGYKANYYPGYEPVHTPGFRPKPAARPAHVPRLKLDVTPRPRHHDVKHRRTYKDRDYYRRKDGKFVRQQALHTRDSAYGYDRDFVHDYYLPNLGDLPTARVQLYTHDSSDPYSCTCYPRASRKTIPSMMYDLVRCPHPQHKYQPAEEDVFTYPWTTQTFRPNVPIKHGYKQGQVLPPSAVTAPPFVLYNAKEHNPKKAKKPAPYSAPQEPLPAPLMSAKPSDRRLRRVDRKRAALPPLATVDEDVYPCDSVSQRPPLAYFRSPSLRLRTVDSPVLGRVNTELEAASRMRALSTPRVRPVLDADGFPETPNRVFKGEYVDSRGQKYQYDIRYGKTTLEGQRTRLQTM